MSLEMSLSLIIDEQEVKELEDLLNVLPQDVFSEIFAHLGLEPKIYTNLSQLSKSWHQFISKNYHDAVKSYLPYLLNNPQSHQCGDYNPIRYFFKECQYYAQKYKDVPLYALLMALGGDPSILIGMPGTHKSLAYALLMLNNHKLPPDVDEISIEIAQKQLLALSAGLGMMETVKRLVLCKGISTLDLENALGEAAYFNHLDMMDFLLHLENKTVSLQEPFCRAAQGGHISALNKMGNFLTYSINTRHTALLNTVSGNHFQAFEYLFYMGRFFPNSVLGEALMIACQKGNFPIAHFLLVKAPGQPQKIKNKALMEAAKSGNAQIVSSLKIAFKTHFLMTYNMMMQNGFDEEANNFYASANKEHDASTVNALIIAAANGHKDAVKLLAQENISDEDYIRAVKEAVRHGYIDIVQLLSLEKINETILLEAITENQSHISSWVLSRLRLSHSNLKNALQRAAKVGNVHTVGLILTVGARAFTKQDKFNAVLTATSHGYLDVVKEFSLEKFSTQEKNMLIQNARSNPDVMLHLLDALKLTATQVAIKIKGKSISLLTFVATYGSCETLQALLNNPNWDWGNLKQAAIDAAIENNKEQNAKLLKGNSEVTNVEIVSRVLVPAFRQSTTIAPPQEHVSSGAAPNLRF